MKLLIVLCAVLAVTLAKPGYFPGGLAALGFPGVIAAPGVAPLGDDDSAIVAQQNAVAVAQGVVAAAQGAAAAAEGVALSSPGAVALAAPGAPVILTAQGVPVDTPEVQAARAANAIAHLQAKAAFLG